MEPVVSAGPKMGGAILLTAEEEVGQQSVGGHGVLSAITEPS